MSSTHEDNSLAPRPSRPRWPPAAVGAVGSVIHPLARSVDFYAQTWRNYLSHQPRELRELPIARPTLALAVHALRDEIVLLALRARRPISEGDAFEPINSEVTAALSFYGRMGWLDDSARFFEMPPTLTDPTIKPVHAVGRSYERMFFDSGYTPRVGEPGRQRWLSYTANNREYALVLRHKENRPWLVCVHGAEKIGIRATLGGEPF